MKERFKKQTLFGEGKGNCLAACIAGLFGMDLDEVPNFCEGVAKGDSSWWEGFSDWLGARGWSVVEVVYDPNLRPREGQLALLTGKSPRGDFNHCVVGIYSQECWEVYYDPHPDNRGLDAKPKVVTFLIPKDPVEPVFFKRMV